MHIIYIDESLDQNATILSALCIPAAAWQQAFVTVRDFRHRHNIYANKQIHAWKLVSGRGLIAPNRFSKTEGVSIFNDALKTVASLSGSGASVFTASFPPKQIEKAFGSLLTRIDTTLRNWDSRAIIIDDGGPHYAFVRTSRRLRVYNPIPSRKGSWQDGKEWKNMPITRLVEEPITKSQKDSYFLQLADCIAYALLRQEHPIASKTAFGLDKSFDLLEPVLFKKATTYDAKGIIRPIKKSP